MDRTDRNPVADHDGETGRSQRAKGRDSLFLMGRLSLPGDTVPRDVRIRNLSEGGLMMEMERPIAMGTTLTLTLRGIGDVTGRVAWCAEGRIGIALDERINPKLARKPVGGGERVAPFLRSQPG